MEKKKEIEASIRNGNAMMTIASGIEEDEEQNEITRKMLEGGLTLDEALEKSLEALKRKGGDDSKQD